MSYYFLISFILYFHYIIIFSFFIALHKYFIIIITISSFQPIIIFFIIFIDIFFHTIIIVLSSHFHFHILLNTIFQNTRVISFSFHQGLYTFHCFSLLFHIRNTFFAIIFTLILSHIFSETLSYRRDKGHISHLTLLY
jgi:hypothetical protein